MGKLLKGAAAVLGLLTAAEAGGNGIFLQENHETLQCKDRAYMKMSGVDLGKIFPAHA